MALVPGSVVGAMLNLMNPLPFGKYVNYLGQEDGVTRCEFENSNLSEYYTLDLSFCHRGKRLNANMLYDIFGSYSNQTGEEVCTIMLNEVTASKSSTDYYNRAGFICLMMRGLTLEDWLSSQVKNLTRGDEMSVYVLCHVFVRHAMIHTNTRSWCTILATGSEFNYAASCQTHLLYMGHHIFRVLRPKPAPPIPLQQPAVPTIQSTGNATSSSIVFSAPLDEGASTSNQPVFPDQMDLPDTNGDNAAEDESSTVNNTIGHTNTVKAVQKASTIAAPLDEVTQDSTDSTVSSVKSKHGVIKISCMDIINKDCKVVLTPLSQDELCKQTDNSSPHMSPKQLVKLLTSFGISSISSDSESVYNQDCGRPRRWTLKVSYVESSQDSGSSPEPPPKQEKILPGSGPSRARMQAQNYGRWQPTQRPVSVLKHAQKDSDSDSEDDLPLSALCNKPQNAANREPVNSDMYGHNTPSPSKSSSTVSKLGSLDI